MTAIWSPRDSLQALKLRAELDFHNEYLRIDGLMGIYWPGHDELCVDYDELLLGPDATHWDIWDACCTSTVHFFTKRFVWSNAANAWVCTVCFRHMPQSIAHPVKCRVTLLDADKERTMDEDHHEES